MASTAPAQSEVSRGVTDLRHDQCLCIGTSSVAVHNLLMLELTHLCMARRFTDQLCVLLTQAESSMAAAQKVVASLRSLRNDYGLTVRQRAAVMLACTDGALAGVLGDMAPEIATLSSSSSVTVLKVRLLSNICQQQGLVADERSLRRHVKSGR